MSIETPFNPLDKKNLGSSVADALLARPRSPLPPREKFLAAGVYAIYYQGDFSPYEMLAAKNRANAEGGHGIDDAPIYVGKAVPKGARKGGFGLDTPPGIVLYDRIRQHADSIRETSNLQVEDFFCRYLPVDDIWIPLGESLLIEMFAPIWNVLVDGFGNHDPGSGRHQGKMSAWDVIHPGRSWTSKLQAGKTPEAILASVEKFLGTKS